MTIDSLQPTSLVIFLFLEHDWTPFASNVQFVSHTRIRAKRLLRVEKGRTVGWRWSVGNESTGMDIFGSVSCYTILHDNCKSTTIRNNKKAKEFEKYISELNSSLRPSTFETEYLGGEKIPSRNIFRSFYHRFLPNTQRK